MDKNIQLKHCSVEFNRWGARTHFPDGRFVDAVPDWQGAHYAVIAHRCGYGDDRLAYCQEHELAHALVCEWLYDDVSDVLWHLAHNDPLTGPEAVAEELLAQTLQRFVRAKERPIVGGVDWDGLRELWFSKLNDC